MTDLLPSLSSDEEDNVGQTRKGEVSPALEEDDDDKLEQDFEFGSMLGDSANHFGSVLAVPQTGWNYQSALDILHRNGKNLEGSSSVPRMDLAHLVEAKRLVLDREKKRKQRVKKHEDNESEAGSATTSSNDDDDDDAAIDNDDKSENGSVENLFEDDVLKTRSRQNDQRKQDDSDDDDDEAAEEAAKAKAFFESSDNSRDLVEIEAFSQLALSRPLLRGVAAMGFTKPTPIQASVIPVALSGRDVCASSATGSGKTGSFLLPILERVFQRRRGGRMNSLETLALILTPTRELAAQCLGMLSTFAQFTKIRSCLVVGGAKNVQSQGAELRTRPDVIVATPGRLLDHVTNTAGFNLDDIEFLVLDEADRLLDLGFQEEVHELIQSCPKERQTLLFSATLTTKVDELIKLSLKRPVRINISSKFSAQGSTPGGVEVAPRLEQEFVRVRAGNEGINRQGILLALLTRTFKARTIVFFETKVMAHRLMIICGLCDIKCAELHGNLTQTQRLDALEEFRKGEVDVLLATDLAARGLDIDRVQSVINFEMPNQVSTYIHRIGRTARAGRCGKSCTLIGEGRRYLMKEVIKDADEKCKPNGAKSSGNGRRSSSGGIIRSRTIPPGVVGFFVEKIHSFESHIEEVLQAEAVARMDRIAEMEALRAKNIIEHHDEIVSRPQREWFASNKQKQAAREAAAAEKARRIAEAVGTGIHRMSRKKRRAREAREEMEAIQEETRREAEEAGRKSKRVFTEETIKASARAARKHREQKELQRRELSVAEEVERRKEATSSASKKKRKGAFVADAAGDASIFQNDEMLFSIGSSSSKSNKKTEEVSLAAGDPVFRDYDPALAGKKKPKRKGHHGFKSKSKYKRRR